MARPDYFFLNQATKIARKFADDYDVKLLIHNGGVHLQLLSDVAIVNLWPTSHKYYIAQTDYLKVYEGLVERGGETGMIPNDVEEFLKKIYYV